MNAHTIQLFDKIMEQSMARFAELPVVKTAVYTDNTFHLVEKVSYITQLYVECFRIFGWLPKEISFYNRVLYGNTKSFTKIIPKDPVLSQLFEDLPRYRSETVQSPVAFHRHFVILPDFYSVSGVIWGNSTQQFFICLSECSTPRDLITISPGRFAFLSDLLEAYDPLQNQNLRNWLSEKEISFNKVQRDSKIYWGEAFYNHYLKVKIIESIEQILFTSETLKEIARQKFGKYLNMYKTFKRYSIELTEIPRYSKT